MEKKEVNKKSVNHAIKIIRLYVEQNPREYPENTTIHETDCELGLAHGKCYCTEHGETRLNYELNHIIENN